MPETPKDSAQIHQLVAFCPVIFATFCVHNYLCLCLHLFPVCIYRYLYTFLESFTTVLEVWCAFTHTTSLYFLKTRILPYNPVQFSRWGNLTLRHYSYPAHVHIQNVTSCSSDAPRWGGGAWYLSRLSWQWMLAARSPGSSSEEPALVGGRESIPPQAWRWCWFWARVYRALGGHIERGSSWSSQIVGWC